MNLKKLEKMNELLAQEMESQRVLGASMLIEHKGKPVFRKVYGADKEDSIYKVFSALVGTTPAQHFQNVVAV